jgi:hypothetical protein
MERAGANLFFQLVSRRYEKGSILITSNQSLAGWGEVFGDPLIATAILDRLLHHSTTINIKGESFRLKEKKRTGLLARETRPTDAVDPTTTEMASSPDPPCASSKTSLQDSLYGPIAEGAAPSLSPFLGISVVRRTRRPSGRRTTISTFSPRDDDHVTLDKDGLCPSSTGPVMYPIIRLLAPADPFSSCYS